MDLILLGFIAGAVNVVTYLIAPKYERAPLVRHPRRTSVIRRQGFSRA